MLLVTLFGVNLFNCIKIGDSAPPRATKAWSKQYRNESRRKEKNKDNKDNKNKKTKKSSKRIKNGKRQNSTK